MTAPHFFVAALGQDRVTITGEDARHAARVLRIRPGEAITVSDGLGTVVDARCTAVDPGSLVARVLERRSVERARPRLIVFPALPKAGKLEVVVQKLTEMGVASIRPWVAARSVVRWDHAKARAHVERLRAVAREAGKQSRSAWLPEIADLADPVVLPLPTVVLHEGAADRLLGALPDDPPEEAGVVVGPEGGLEQEEIDRLRAAGAQVAGLGPQILRAETAAIVGAALVLARYGLMG